MSPPTPSPDDPPARAMASAAVTDARPAAGPYQLFMLGLCIYVLAALAAQTLIPLDAETVKILDRADDAICLIFFFDFLHSLLEAPDRKRYLLRWGWLDLLSSIPAVDLLRWGRAARIFRILRVLRGLKAARVVSTFVLERRAECALWATSLIAILVTIFGSVAVLQFETAPEANIRGGDDALWWAFVTITTVGYGDHYPVTGAGRILAAAMMITGIGLFGTFTAFVASAFMAPGEAEQEEELAGLRGELRELRQALERHSFEGNRLEPSTRVDGPAPEKETATVETRQEESRRSL